jgi:hypothetical protein
MYSYAGLFLPIAQFTFGFLPEPFIHFLFPHKWRIPRPSQSPSAVKSKNRNETGPRFQTMKAERMLFEGRTVSCSRVCRFLVHVWLPLFCLMGRSVWAQLQYSRRSHRLVGSACALGRKLLERQSSFCRELFQGSFTCQELRWNYGTVVLIP